MAPSFERLVEVAAPDQNEVDEVPGEFQQQPFGRIVPPGAEPAVREPGTVAVPEAELHRSWPGRGFPADSQTPRTKLPLPRLPPLFSADARGFPVLTAGFPSTGPDVSVLSVMVHSPFRRRVSCIARLG